MQHKRSIRRHHKQREKLRTKRIMKQWGIRINNTTVGIHADNFRIWRIRGGKNMKGENRLKKTKRVRAERILPNGYYQVRTMANNKRMHMYSPRIVWMYYNGGIPKGHVIDHINGNKSDNRITNLEPVTNKENRVRAKRLFQYWVGENNSMSKITERDVKEIRSMKSRGAKSKDVANIYNMSTGQINDIAARRAWKHVS